MSDEIERENRESARGLMATDDAMVWAEEFCRIFDGSVITAEPAENEVDPGLMVAWFANAMQVAIDMDKARQKRLSAATEHVPTEVRDAFVLGVDDGREPESE